MKVIVNKNYVLFDVNTKVNKREFKATPLEFTFSEEYEGLTCKCVFSKIPATSEEEITFYQQPIIDNKCYIPYEVMDSEGILIGVYGYSVDGEELLLRYSPKPKNLWFLEGSYYEGAETPEEILPSQFEQYTAYLNSQIARLNQIKIETEQLSDGVKISVTNADGVTTETEVYNGEKGEPGERGEPGEPGTTDYEDLVNKPSINGTTLEGDVSLEDIGIGSVFTIKGSVATPNDLPLTGNSIGDVYYVESVMAGFVWIEVDNVERWEELGEPIDLSDYYTKTETDNLLADKQHTLTAGNGIDITNNVISATGGDSYKQVYYLTTSFASRFATSLNATDIATCNKIIDEWRSGKDILVIAKDITFWTSSTSNDICKYAFGVISSSGNNIYFTFYRPYVNGENISVYSTCLSRFITFSNVGTPANVSSASLSKANQPSVGYDIIRTGNTTSYNVSGDYNPAHKKYVDDKPTTYAGYDSTKTQVLKNINGTLTWVDEV